MVTKNIDFQSINWTEIPKIEDKGKKGFLYSRTTQYNGLRIRMVEYSKDYFANHWCEKGHIVQCLEGVFVIELKKGEKVTLRKGMTFIVSDEMSSHRSIAKDGATLLIIDGDFLKKNE